MRADALRQLIACGLDAVLDVGDRRGQGRDRAVDIGCRAVHRVQQRARLAERRLGGTHGVDEPNLAVGRPREQVARVGDVLIGERQSLLGGFDIAGDGSKGGIGELLVQSRERLLRRVEAGGQVDHLLGHRVQPARRVDDQVPQL